MSRQLGKFFLRRGKNNACPYFVAYFVVLFLTVYSSRYQVQKMIADEIRTLESETASIASVRRDLA